MPQWRRWVRSGVSIGGGLTGALVGLSPIIKQGQTYLPSGNVQGFASAVGGDYTGDYGKDWSRAVTAWSALLGGIAVIYATRFIARRI